MTSSLSYGGTTINFSPIIAITPIFNQELGRIVHTALDGTIYIYNRYSKLNHEITINNINSLDAQTLNTWANNGYQLTYTPNTSEPGTTYTVYILNENPMQFMDNVGNTTIYQGTLRIREA